MRKKVAIIAEPTIGADIEVFLQNKDTNEIVSAEGIVQGSKHAPFFFKDGNPFFATSLDNVMCEFCIPPASTEDEFSDSIQEALDYIRKTIPKNLIPLAVPSAYLNEKYLQTENAQLFGCEPDFNAWEYGSTNPRPDAITNLRSCGGHIHIGYKKPDRDVSRLLMCAMDIYVGLASVIQEPDNERKTLYGKAGAFRWKSYGAEYRTVSNYYLATTKLRKWAFNNTMEAIEFINRKNPVTREEADAIQLAINTNNKELAQTLCTYFGVKLA
jgi:hypothetical protein